MGNTHNVKFKQPSAMQYGALLYVGLCGKCKHTAMMNCGNGVNDPLDPILICKKKEFEIIQVPEEDEIKECELFESYI